MIKQKKVNILSFRYCKIVPLLRRHISSTLTHFSKSYINQQQIKQKLLPASHFCLQRTKATQTPASKPWIPIYRLPLIRWAASFNRLKIYQAIVTAVGTPASYALVNIGTLNPGTDTLFAILGVTGVLTLTLCSLLPQNLIGFIYINEQQDRVKLAYVDFWGRRQEMEIDVNDIVPESEQQRPSRNNFYKKICLYSNPKRKFKLLTHYGVIMEPNKFVEVVGE